MRRYILVIGIIIIVFLGIVVFWPKSKQKVENQQGTKTLQSEQLPGLADTDAQVSLDIHGQISADQTFRTIRITVNRSLSTITIYQGFQGQVLQQKSYANNQNSFQTFLYGLNATNFTASKVAPKGSTEQGSCPLGQRLVYEVTDGNETLLHSWTTSCAKTLGTFNGRTADTRQLFQLQIPDYDTMTSSVQL